MSWDGRWVVLGIIGIGLLAVAILSVSSLFLSR